jgi:hypothetical protein
MAHQFIDANKSKHQSEEAVNHDIQGEKGNPN